MSTNTLLNLYAEATPAEITQGHSWYHEAFTFAVDVAIKYHLPRDVVAQVIAVLSPACPWERNKLDASALCEAFHNGQSLEDIRICTYGNNKQKAIRILQGLETLQPKAIKTYNFYQNIMGNLGVITVDRHAVKAYKGKTKAGTERVPKDLYNRASRAYTRAAEIVHIEPAQFQAVIWLVYKRKHNR
jgi:hypothetical protein